MIDNLRESAYCQLMTALAQDGQRSAALSQYQICQKRLNAELGVSPSQETTALYEQIQSDALHQTKAPASTRATGQRERMPVFLLTDIEGSTRLWDTHHQAMLSALLQHNTILEAQISRHGGRILPQLRRRRTGRCATHSPGSPRDRWIRERRPDGARVRGLRRRPGPAGTALLRGLRTPLTMTAAGSNWFRAGRHESGSR